MVVSAAATSGGTSTLARLAPQTAMVVTAPARAPAATLGCTPIWFLPFSRGDRLPADELARDRMDAGPRDRLGDRHLADPASPLERPVDVVVVLLLERRPLRQRGRLSPQHDQVVRRADQFDRVGPGPPFEL